MREFLLICCYWVNFISLSENLEISLEKQVRHLKVGVKYNSTF